MEDANTNASLGLEHLEAELARIDALIGREVRRWQRAGQDPTDALRGLYISDTEANTLAKQPLATGRGQTVDLEPGEAQDVALAQAQAERQVQSILKMARDQGQVLRLVRLATAFDLSRFELAAFLIALAPTLDLRYEHLYAYLQDDVTRKRPSVNLVLDLLCEPGLDRLLMLPYFADDAPLFKYQFIERAFESGPGTPPLLRQTLCVDQAIMFWLSGYYQPHADLGAHATLLHPQQSATDALLAAEARPDLERAAAGRDVLVFYGPDAVRQRAAARLLAAHAGRALLRVNLAAVIEAGVSPARALRLALRDARLTGAIPFLAGWEAVGAPPPPALLAELCVHPDLLIVAGQELWQPQGIRRERRLLWLEFPVPAYAQRRALWSHFLQIGMWDLAGSAVPGDGQGEASPEHDVSGLAGQFLLTTGQIRDAVASACDVAAQERRPLQDTDLYAAARAYSNPRLSSLARKIMPRYTWSDIILPDDQLNILHEIVATVRERPLVLEAWGVGLKLASSAGVTILFAGPPGTGKTMGAEVIATELGLDLYKIDLSSIVSKYIGETEKNLEKIFSEAQSSNAILFFDEADAIFGKRSEVKDAHDRYANIEISYLLQRMEAYDGVTILATNLRANLDEAFTRRLQFAVHFPFPSEDYRRRIWETLFPPDVPREAGLDFALLARRFKLAGGNIRNIIVSAAYLAASDGREVTMAHLFHSTRRELQKMGRLVGEEDFR
jgi:ATP-dependent 26S proteasome regulatory subunit